MFKIELRLPKKNWFRIWESEDGHDTANYLQQCVENDRRKDAEYRMTYVKENYVSESFNKGQS